MTVKQFCIRTTLTAALPLILLYVFFVTLITEIGRAFRYAWLEVVDNFDRYLFEMRRGDY